MSASIGSALRSDVARALASPLPEPIHLGDEMTHLLFRSAATEQFIGTHLHVGQESRSDGGGANCGGVDEDGVEGGGVEDAAIGGAAVEGAASGGSALGGAASEVADAHRAESRAPAGCVVRSPAETKRLLKRYLLAYAHVHGSGGGGGVGGA